MSTLVLILSVVVSSKLVFVASKTCTESSDCEEVGSCCYDGVCTTYRLKCLVKDKERNLFCCASRTCDCSQEDITCYSDLQCDNGGCCADSKCHPKSSWRCPKSCTENWECTSGCCKNNKCQATNAECNTCYENWDCTSGCCKFNQCQDSYDICSRAYEYDTTDSWPETTPGHSYDDDDYYYNGYNNGHDKDHENSSGGLAAGPSIGIAITVISVVISLCGCYSRSRRRQGVLVERRRVPCVRVPIVENDQLQREHERAEGEIPARLPSAYSPRDNTPKEPHSLYTPMPTTSSNETSESAQAHGARNNTAHVHGVHQGETMVPPAAYQSNYVANTEQNGNTDQNANTEQNANTNQNGNTDQNSNTDQNVNTAQTQAAGMTGNAEQANGVPQGSLQIPPSTNPASS